MEYQTIQERFEALRKAYIAQNPVDLRDDLQVEDALAAWRELDSQTCSSLPFPQSRDSRACHACDAPVGGGNR